MPDFIGTIPVTSPTPSGTFPIPVLFGLTKLLDPPYAIHTFIAADQKREQRFLLGPGARQWTVQCELSPTDQQTLKSFYEGQQGSLIPFTWNEPLEDGTTESVTVQFANEPFLIDELPGLISTWQMDLLEVYTGSGPVYTSAEVDLRFPGSVPGQGTGTLATALTAQLNTVIPLVKIQPRNTSYPAIYLSDRRCTVDSQLYLPRLLWNKCSGIGQTGIGLPNVNTEADAVTLVFGNADRVMRQLVNSVQLDQAYVWIDIFHVQSNIRVQLWAGTVVTGGWASSQGPEFTLQCSDIINSPFLVAPPRAIDHLCNKLFADGNECPFQTNCQDHVANTLDLVNFPSALTGSCDHGYNTPNGCQAHTMSFYFNGIVIAPQGVRIQNNATGLFGFDRSTFTSVSLISDSAYGQAVPIVVCSIDFPVNCTILAGRDEGDFYEAFGVVCQGPVSFSPNNPSGGGGLGFGTQVDSQFNSNYPNLGGLRTISGTDPAGYSDMVSLDETGNQTGVWPVVNTIVGVGSPFYMVVWETGPQAFVYVGDAIGNGITLDWNFSAGTAFVSCRIRQSQVSGTSEVLTTLDQHTMQTWVNQGWGGWSWYNFAGDLEYGFVAPITNPVYFMFNLLLLCLKFYTGTQTEQESVLDIINSANAIATCFEIVERVVEQDQGTETQWVCIGSLATQRPLRDWLNDIATNFLGYFYWNYGKLCVGARYEAVPQSAYTDYNIIWRSLDLQPIGPQYTKLLVNFADREYQFQPNSASYQDDDYAEELGAGLRANHLTATMNLAFTADISPASRFTITRCREEIGGINAAERIAARKIKFSSTILALDTAPGMVISVTDQEVPNGTGLFLVLKWQLNPDWSVDIWGRTVTPSMYALDTGPAVTAALPAPGQPLAYPYPLAPVWMPNYEAPMSGDVIYTASDLSFQVTEFYTTLADGTLHAVLTLTGYLPVAQTEANTQQSYIRSCTSLSTGGHIPGGQSYFVAIAQISTTGGISPISNICAVFIPSGTNTNKIILTDIDWAGAPSEGWAGYIIFVGPGSSQILTEYSDVTDGNTGQPTTVNIPGPLKVNSYGPPSPAYAYIEPKVKLGEHFGVAGEEVSVVNTGNIVIDALGRPQWVTGTAYAEGDYTSNSGNSYIATSAGTSGSTPPTWTSGSGSDGGVTWLWLAATSADTWAGRTLSIIGRPTSGTVPRMDFSITSFNILTGELALTPDPNAAGVLPFDLAIINFKATSVTANSISDTGIVSSLYPTGNTVNAEIGFMIYCLQGTGAHQNPRTVIANTASTWTLDADWEVQPDSTTLFVVVAGPWLYTQANTPASSCGTYGVLAQASITVDNFEDQPVLVGGFLVDRLGNESPESTTPLRLGYIFGQPGTLNGLITLARP